MRSYYVPWNCPHVAIKIKGRQAPIAVTAKCHSDFGEQMFGTLEGTIEF